MLFCIVSKCIKILFLIILIFPLSSKANKPLEKFLSNDYVFSSEEDIQYPYDTGLWGSLETHMRIHPNSWALRYDNDISVTNEYSLRFEKRLGDCGIDDCERKEGEFTGRSELIFFDRDNKDNIKGHIGEYWYSWSFLIHPDSDGPTKNKEFLHIGQFKQWLKHEKLTRQYLTDQNIDKFNVVCPEMSLYFSWRPDGIHVGRSGVVKCDGDSKKIIDKSIAKGQWHHMLANINWTDEDNGKIRLWLNEELVFQLNGKTISKIVEDEYGNKMGPIFRFGIYGQGKIGDQIVYYDNLKALDSCDNFYIYNCESLNNQKIQNGFVLDDPDTGNQIVGQFETNDDPEKRKRIIKTLIKKITKSIEKKSKSSSNEIEAWVTSEINQLDWEKDLDKSKDRKKIRDKLIKKGIKKFK